jgi:hypothetical protein
MIFSIRRSVLIKPSERFEQYIDSPPMNMLIMFQLASKTKCDTDQECVDPEFARDSPFHCVGRSPFHRSSYSHAAP